MLQPLYMTYWPGMTAIQCNSQSHSLQANAAVQTQIDASLNLSSRNAPLYEACYWIINAIPNTFRDTAMIYIWANQLTNANMYIYAGSDRQNVT